MVNDALGGMAGGLAGTAAMTVLLFGYLLSAAAGVIAWPLLFVSLVQYLPGGRDEIRGAVFATVLWISFAMAFGSGLDGVSLALYLVSTLVAHWVYGLILGGVYGRFADHRTGVV